MDTIAYGAPPLTPPHKGEGDFAVVKQSIDVHDFERSADLGVSLPLVGRVQAWGCAAVEVVENFICDSPALERGVVH